jgi:nucleotide-binding universal stress UspA family protein
MNYRKCSLQQTYVKGGEMNKKILVCLDGSKFAEQILPIAIERGHYFKSKLVLLKVINVNFGGYATPFPGYTPFITPEVMDGIISGEEMKAKAYLDNIVSQLSETELDVDAVVLHKLAQGSISSTITAYAKAIGSDLIMIATHQYRGWKRLIFGSTAESLIREAVLPVLAINPQDTSAQDDTSFKKTDTVPA